MEIIRLIDYAPEGFLVSGVNVAEAREALERTLSASGAMIRLDFAGVTATRESAEELLSPAAGYGADGLCRLVLAGCDPDTRATVTRVVELFRRGW